MYVVNSGLWLSSNYVSASNTIPIFRLILQMLLIILTFINLYCEVTSLFRAEALEQHGRLFIYDFTLSPIFVYWLLSH